MTSYMFSTNKYRSVVENDMIIELQYYAEIAWVSTEHTAYVHKSRLVPSQRHTFGSLVFVSIAYSRCQEKTAMVLLRWFSWRQHEEHLRVRMKGQAIGWNL